MTLILSFCIFSHDSFSYGDFYINYQAQSQLNLLTTIDDGGIDQKVSRECSVMSSYKLNLPPSLIIHKTDIKLLNMIGQGEKSSCNCSGLLLYCLQLIFVCAKNMMFLFIISGEFGVVYKGHIIANHRPDYMEVVAVKTLKGYY